MRGLQLEIGLENPKPAIGAFLELDEGTLVEYSLEEKGLIVSQTEGKRRYLLITEKGRRVLAAMDVLRILL